MQRNAVEMQRNVQWVLCTMCNVYNVQYAIYVENIAHVGSYRNLKNLVKNLKKFVHAFVVNVIHAKVLPDFDL